MRQTTVDLRVSGRSCASCVARLEGALGHVPGVAEVNVNLAMQRGTVTSVPAVIGPQGLRQAIEDLGYEVPEPTGPVEDKEVSRSRYWNHR